jgi:threonine synthase
MTAVAQDSMRYVSTRGGMAPAAFCDILLEGLAPDGGLTIPEDYPRIDRATLASWRGLDYRGLAFEILSRYIDDIPAADLRAIIDRTYTRAAFGSDEITPVRTLEPGLHLLQLSNGPTLAFKDLAMQLLGGLFEHVLARRGETLNILGATSGDTGSAAEYAMRGKRGIRVFMLSPHGKMSAFQTAQMYSLADPNIFNLAVRGVFDDCQDVVKAVSGDLDFKARYRIGSVNSINWARLVAQVVYYFKGYFAVTRGEDEEVSFAVPSGNFGNIFAGHVARAMGLPIRKLIVATNENNVLDEFFRTGLYRVRGSAEVFQTSSPSMDISKASNFERYVYDLVGRDPARVRELWRRVDAQGAFDLSGSAYFKRVEATGFVSDFSTHADRLATIRRVHAQYGYVVDTHTADGIKVGLGFREAGIPLVCLETAAAVKFDAAIREALGTVPPRPKGCENLEALPQRFEVIEADAEAVKRFIASVVGAS